MIQQTTAKVLFKKQKFSFISFFILNILGEYSSSKKLLDSNLESSTRVTRHSRSRFPNFITIII